MFWILEPIATPPRYLPSRSLCAGAAGEKLYICASFREKGNRVSFRGFQTKRHPAVEPRQDVRYGSIRPSPTGKPSP